MPVPSERIIAIYNDAVLGRPGDYDDPDEQQLRQKIDAEVAQMKEQGLGFDVPSELPEF